MTKDKKALFDWTLALLINWQIDHLKKEYKKKDIDLAFFNKHNTLSSMTIATFPYFLSSATLEHKGFHWYGTWIGVRFNGFSILVPDRYQKYVSTLYTKISEDNKLQLQHLNYPIEDNLPKYEGYARHEQSSYMQVLLDGLVFIKYYTPVVAQSAHMFLEFEDAKYVAMMRKNSAVDISWMFLKSGPRPKVLRRGDTFLKKLSDEKTRHVYSKEYTVI